MRGVETEMVEVKFTADCSVCNCCHSCFITEINLKWVSELEI